LTDRDIAGVVVGGTGDADDALAGEGKSARAGLGEAGVGVVDFAAEDVLGGVGIGGVVAALNGESLFNIYSARF
jgi:hypothetical protein